MGTKLTGIFVAVLAIALIAGTGYLLARPADAEAVTALGQRGGAGSLDFGGRGDAGTGRGQGAGSARVCDGDCETGGDGFANARAFERNSDVQGRRVGEQLQGQGQGAGRYAAPDVVGHVDVWETLSGVVTAVGSEITVQTDEGAVLVGLGQAWYRDEAGFVIEVGDEVVVSGFYEDGEFKAGTVENSTTGETLTLRDETGRPMWAGQGQRKNQNGL